MKSLYYILFFVIFNNCFYAQQPQVITQEKNLGTISKITYSPDGKYVASINEKDFLIKIWDIQSSKLIGTLNGHNASINNIEFNQNGNELYSNDKANNHYIWDLNNWKLKDSINLFSSISLITDDFENVYLLNETDVSKFNFNTKKTEVVVPKQKAKLTNFAINSSHIAVVTAAKEVLVFDRNTLKLLNKTIPNPKYEISKILLDQSHFIVAYENGQIATHYLNDAKIVSNIKTGISNAPNDITLHTASHKIAFPIAGIKVKEFDYLSGLPTNELNITDNHENIRSLSYSPNGITIAISGYKKLLLGRVYSNNNVIQIWDFPNKKQVKTLKGDVNPIESFTFGQQHNVLYLLRGTYIDIWNLNSGERISKTKLHDRKIEIAARIGDGISDKTYELKSNVSNDLKNANTSKIKNAKAIASGDLSSIAKQVAKSKQSAIKESKYIGKAAFSRFGFQEDKLIISKNDKYLISALKDDEIRIYSIEQFIPKHISYIKTGQREFFDVLIDPNEQFVAIGGSGNTPVSIIQLNDLTNPLTLKIDDSQDLKMGGAFQTANAMAINPDGTRLIVAFNTGRIVIWNTQNWNKITDFRLGFAMTMKPFVGFSGDGNKFFVNTAIGVITYDFTVYNQLLNDENVEEGKSLNIEKTKIQGHPVMTHKPIDYLVSIDASHVSFLDVLNNKTVSTESFNTKLISDVQINKFGYTGVSLKNGELRVYDPSTAKERFIMVGEDDNALFKTPENYYKVTKEGHDLVIFRVGKNAYPFDQFDTKYNRPDIVLTAMNSEDPNLVSLYKNSYTKRLAKLGIKESDLDNNFRAPNIEIANLNQIPLLTNNNKIALEITANDTHHQLKKLAVYINDVPIYGVKGMAIAGNVFEKTVEIELASGVNRIQVFVENSGGVESLKQTIEIENTVYVKPNLFLLSIGTSIYKDKKYNLNYAAKDAKDLVTIFSEDISALYKSVKTKTITNQEATKNQIQNLKSFFKDVQINDVVMIFVAGHGLLDVNYDYFYGTHDIDFLKPQNKGLPYQSLENLLDGIKALKKILIMDTCHSGEVEEDDLVAAVQQEEEDTGDVLFRAVGPKLSTTNAMSPTKMMKELFVDLRKGTGTTVLSSAGGAEFAMESNDWKNGLFTYCLLFGIRNGGADLNNDGKIMLSELQIYTIDKVTQLSNGKQTPTTRVQNIHLDYQIW